MNDKARVFNHRPTFYLPVSDGSHAHVGLFAGDVILCDRETDPANFVIGVWDDQFHICTNVYGKLFDEATHSFAPEYAEILGRVLYVIRQLVPPHETTERPVEAFTHSLSNAYAQGAAEA